MNREEVAKKLCDLGLVLLSCKYDGFVECHKKCKQYNEMLKIATWIDQYTRECVREYIERVKQGHNLEQPKIGQIAMLSICDTILNQLEEGK